MIESNLSSVVPFIYFGKVKQQARRRGATGVGFVPGKKAYSVATTNC